MKKLLYLILLLLSFHSYAQLNGKVRSAAGEIIPFAEISIGSSSKAISNIDGEYSLEIPDSSFVDITVSSLGYKTITNTIITDAEPYDLDFVLQPERGVRQWNRAIRIDSVAGNKIVSLAIKNRKANAAKTNAYEADFYSKGSYMVRNVPREIMGKELTDLEGRLDSTGSGILYLSETVSRIKYQRPNDFYEHIIASKVSGDDKGYSYNTASSAEFDFYQSYISFDVNVISPLSEDAPAYYDYALQGFLDGGGFERIAKVKVTPQKENTAAMYGYIYLWENTGELYAVELAIEGRRIELPLLDDLIIKQNYAYNDRYDTWVKSRQTLDFSFNLLDVKIDCNFLHSYSNYNLQPGFNRKTFGSEILRIDKEANKKTGNYWTQNRPSPLTNREIADYIRKDSIETVHTSAPYLRASDSIRNHYKLLSPVIGHTYYNSSDSWQIKYSGILLSIGFNTVQAYALSPSFSYTKSNAEDNTYTTFGTTLNYGFAEDRFRATGKISRKFNNFSKRIITLSGGSSIEQFNPEEPITRIVNSVSTLFFKDNYMKLYDNNFINLAYEEEVVNGIYLYSSVEYTRRRPLYNNTTYSTLKDVYDPYTSNNPLLPYDYETPAFLKHNMFRASVATQISFGQKYRTKPDGKENVPNPLYPQLYIKFEKGFAASIDDYNYAHLSSKLTYSLSIGQYGQTSFATRAGIFFNSENIAFTDYRHFNGNRTHVADGGPYLNSFNFLHYYSHSTNDRYAETHLEHNFKGFITNKIPLLEKLNYYLVGGVHALHVPEHGLYSEYTVGLDNLGWGKVRFIRLDYIRAYEKSSFAGDGFVLGLSLLKIFQ